MLKESLHPGGLFYYNSCLPLTIHSKYFIIKFGQIICLRLKVCHCNAILSLILLLPRQTRRNQFHGERNESRWEGGKRQEKLDKKR